VEVTKFTATDAGSQSLLLHHHHHQEQGEEEALSMLVPTPIAGFCCTNGVQNCPPKSSIPLTRTTTSLCIPFPYIIVNAMSAIPALTDSYFIVPTATSMSTYAALQ